MNRAERRKKIPASEAKVGNMIMYKEGINYATDCIYASVLMILHDKFGFGATRCQRFLKQVEEQVDCVNKGYLSLDDIKETVSYDSKMFLSVSLVSRCLGIKGLKRIGLFS